MVRITTPAQPRGWIILGPPIYDGVLGSGFSLCSSVTGIKSLDFLARAESVAVQLIHPSGNSLVCCAHYVLTGFWTVVSFLPVHTSLSPACCCTNSLATCTTTWLAIIHSLTTNTTTCWLRWSLFAKHPWRYARTDPWDHHRGAGLCAIESWSHRCTTRCTSRLRSSNPSNCLRHRYW